MVFKNRARDPVKPRRSFNLFSWYSFSRQGDEVKLSLSGVTRGLALFTFGSLALLLSANFIFFPTDISFQSGALAFWYGFLIIAALAALGVGLHSDRVTISRQGIHIFKGIGRLGVTVVYSGEQIKRLLVILPENQPGVRRIVCIPDSGKEIMLQYGGSKALLEKQGEVIGQVLGIGPRKG